MKTACLIGLLLILGTGSAVAQVMTVTLLGTGTPRPDSERFSQAILVETPEGDRLLFDAGRGAAMRLHQIGVSSDQIDAIFVTHLHYDHIVGLDDVWLTARLWQRSTPLTVYGPQGTASFVEHITNAYAVDQKVRHRQSGLPEQGGTLQAVEIASGQVYASQVLKVTAFPVAHGAVKPAFGYRVDYGERSVVISGDTTYSKTLVEHAQGAQVIIHEVMMASEALLTGNARLRKVQAYHSTPEQVGKVLTETGAQLGVLVHQLRFGVSEAQLLEAVQAHYAGEVRLGEDLMAIDIGESTFVYQRH